VPNFKPWAVVEGPVAEFSGFAKFKSEFTRGPGRGDTCHLSVFDETLPG